jgi:succinoglycan biosynthesis transport protein ExoP
MLQQLTQAQLTSPDSDRIPGLEAEYREKQQIYDENHPDLVSLRRQIDSLKASGTGGMSLQAQLQSQQSALSQARTRYSEDHPDVKRIVRRIEALQARIASGESATSDPQTRSPVSVQLQTQVNAIDTQLASMQARAAELRGRLSMFETRISSTPEVEREYQNLNRGLELARTKYDELLKRQMDSEVNTAAISRGAADEFRLVQPPGLPDRPAKPLRIAIAAIGLVLAGFFALVAMLVADALDTTVRGARDLRRILGESPLAIVPDIMDDGGVAARNRQAATYGGGLIALGVVMFAVVRVVFA